MHSSHAIVCMRALGAVMNSCCLAGKQCLPGAPARLNHQHGSTDVHEKCIQGRVVLCNQPSAFKLTSASHLPLSTSVTLFHNVEACSHLNVAQKHANHVLMGVNAGRSSAFLPKAKSKDGTQFIEEALVEVSKMVSFQKNSPGAREKDESRHQFHLHNFTAEV
eukprot:1156412-Pelagomonas_calceolata.AAC.4